MSTAVDGIVFFFFAHSCRRARVKVGRRKGQPVKNRAGDFLVWGALALGSGSYFSGIRLGYKSIADFLPVCALH